MLFSVSYREEVREKIIREAREDKRIVAAAVVGSYASNKVDRWSDIDLTFAVGEEYSVSDVLQSWTDFAVKEFSALTLLDVQRGKTIYRVFILPGCLQLDLSFSPAAEFGAIGGHFNLLYGKQYDRPQPKQQPAEEIFGWMLHHILRARYCAERNKLWQAELWISEARNYALKLACIAGGLTPDYGRGFDELPEDVLSLFKNSFVSCINKDEILRAVKTIAEALPNISKEVKVLTEKFGSALNEISK